jgi:hypothetical protein
VDGGDGVIFVGGLCCFGGVWGRATAIAKAKCGGLSTAPWTVKLSIAPVEMTSFLATWCRVVRFLLFGVGDAVFFVIRCWVMRLLSLFGVEVG